MPSSRRANRKTAAFPNVFAVTKTIIQLKKADLTLGSAAASVHVLKGIDLVIGQGEAVRFAPVTTGARTGDQVAVQGLQAGQRVVVQGAGFLGEGDHVTVAPATAAAAAPAPAGQAAR